MILRDFRASIAFYLLYLVLVLIHLMPAKADHPTKFRPLDDIYDVEEQPVHKSTRELSPASAQDAEEDLPDFGAIYDPNTQPQAEPKERAKIVSAPGKDEREAPDGNDNAYPQDVSPLRRRGGRGRAIVGVDSSSVEASRLENPAAVTAEKRDSRIHHHLHLSETQPNGKVADTSVEKILETAAASSKIEKHVQTGSTGAESGNGDKAAASEAENPKVPEPSGTVKLVAVEAPVPVEQAPASTHQAENAPASAPNRYVPAEGALASLGVHKEVQGGHKVVKHFLPSEENFQAEGSRQSDQVASDSSQGSQDAPSETATQVSSSQSDKAEDGLRLEFVSSEEHDVALPRMRMGRSIRDDSSPTLKMGKRSIPDDLAPVSQPKLAPRMRLGKRSVHPKSPVEYYFESKKEEESLAGESFKRNLREVPPFRRNKPRFPTSFCELERDSGIICPSSRRGLYLEQFYYDPAGNRCYHFIYNGCGGNANRFSSLWECTQACGKPSTETN